MICIETISSMEELEKFTTAEEFAGNLHEMLIPFEDNVRQIRDGINYAMDSCGGRGGFILAALDERDIVGALVMLKTNMSGYVPENLLLYIAVDKSKRGKGIGTILIKKALKLAKGNVKLHVEFDNPAKTLYEKIGFVSKYADMRYSNE
ncbi:MAG: GNAT family N-acetyltransferase [Candidatus Sabulitectum sp.]|nr:GNAT family N-acetyltransferase [Candidatus Sabulitectum sp.]